MAELRDDGYHWAQGLISNPKSWTLVGPDDFNVAHVYPCDGRTWRAAWDDGEVIAEGFTKSGDAFRGADNAARPCAFVDTDSSHGILPCDNDRAPGSPFCAPHKAREDRMNACDLDAA